MTTDQKKRTKSNLEIKATVITAIIIVIIVLAGSLIYFWQKGSFTKVFQKEQTYKAIFLSNNQVLFGKIKRQTGDSIFITDVYYLKEKQVLGPGGEPQQPQLELIKRGQELHRPQDGMEINRDYIMYIEELAPDSPVVRKIKEINQQK